MTGWTWKHLYAACIFVLLAASGLYFLVSAAAHLSPAVAASAIWGGLTLVLCLTFMLGAAATERQFLIFFGSGTFGAGMGYLVGVWLTPGGDSNPLDQVRNIVAGVLSGVVGTKLLSLWDDLVDKPATGPPPIMTSTYFLPIVLFLVGFTVSLSAFYTVRASESGDVRVTYSPRGDVRLVGPKPTDIGILPSTVVQFAGAANSPLDVRVDWSFRLQEPCAATIDKALFDKEMTGSFDPVSGKLQTPSASTLDRWSGICPSSLKWSLVATSTQDKAKFASYDLRLCRSSEDCPLASSGKGNTGATPAGTSGAMGNTGVPASGPPLKPAAEIDKPGDHIKPK